MRSREKMERNCDKKKVREIIVKCPLHWRIMQGSDGSQEVAPQNSTPCHADCFESRALAEQWMAQVGAFSELPYQPKDNP